MRSGKASTDHRAPVAIARLVLAVLPVVVVVGWLVGAAPAHAATPTIDISDAVPNPVTEGAAATTTNVTFTVTLAESPGPAVKVSFATMLGSATANVDYVFQESSVTFPAGATGADLVKTITVVVNGDNAPEPNETFFIQLYSPTGGGVLGDRWGQATINNDDGAPPSISVSDATPSPVVEGNSGTTPASFNVVLSASPSALVTYKWASNPATAAAGTDYVVATGTGTFAAGTGTLTQTVTVQVNGDTTPEGHETFLLQIYDVGGASVTDAYGGATIQNDDAAVPIISIADVTNVEGTTAQVPVTLSFSPPGPVTVKFRTMQDTYFNTTATAGSDYTAEVSTLSWTAGDPVLTKTIDIPIAADALTEAPERFYVQIYDPVGGNLAAIRYGKVTINTAPLATADVFDAIGNTGLFVGTTRPATQAGREITGSVLANDTDPDVPPGGLVVVAETKPTTLGGSVVIEADGNFTYHPDDADVGVTDSFTYTVGDGEATATGTVNVVLTGQVWYVRNNEPAGGDGTSDTPFDTLAEAEAASGTGDTVFVFDGSNTTTNLDTGYAMNANERLIGESRPLSLDPDGGGPLPTSPLHPGTSGAQPTLTASNEDVIVLASNVLVDGVDVDPSGTGGGISGGAGTDAVTVQNANVTDTGTAGTQPGIEMDGTTGVNRFTGVTVTNGGSATAIGVRINNADRVLFANTATNTIATSGAKALDAASTSLLTSRWNDITVTGSGTGAIRLSSTTGQPVLGDGAGTDLSLQTTSGATAALDIASSNTVTVDSAGTDTISATGGPAADIRNSNGSQFFFDSASSTNSAGDGINLDTNLTAPVVINAGTISGAAGIAFDVNGGGVGGGGVVYDGAINDGPGQSVEVTGRDGGGVTFSGNIADSADVGGGIVVSGNSAGSTTFSGASKVLNTGASNAVTLAANGNPAGGHLVLFMNGGLDIDTTSGQGLTATNGTLTVGGTGNSITTGTGRALNVDTAGITGGNLNFESISSNGSTNGIRLNTTGTTGGLIVTGTGGACATTADPCSGGTIQNTTQDAVSLTSAQAITLQRVKIRNSLGNGVRGSSVTNFALRDSVVDNNGDDPATDEAGLHFTNLAGSSEFTRTLVANSPEDNARIVNAAGTLSQLNVTDSTFRDTDTVSPGNNGLLLQADGGSITADVLGNTFLRNRANGLQVITNGTGSMDIEVDDSGAVQSTFDDNNIGVSIAHNSSGSFNFDVRDLTIDGLNVAPGTGGSASPINVNLASVASTTMSGNITGNTLTNSNSTTGPGIRLIANGSATMTVLVDQNNVSQVANRGIEVIARDGSSRINATITSNNVTLNNALSADAIRVDAGSVSTDTTTVCAEISGNTSSTTAVGLFGIRVRQRFPGTTFILEDYAGAPTDDAAVQAFLSATNNGSAVSADHGGAGFTSIADCPMPT